MGILGLSKLLYQKCPNAVKEDEMKNYFGRRVAIDASMSIYQFIIAMKGFSDGQGVELTNENGEITSHINGLFARTLRMVDEGLKPIYVFDGKPPEMKRGELQIRQQRAKEAEDALAKAMSSLTEEGAEPVDDEQLEKLSKRTVRVTREQTEECKRLLKLMGIPVVEAPCEAEAQCAELVRGNRAWAVATEDMDALTFGSKILLRHLTFSEAKKRPVAEYHLDEVLAQTGLSMDSFIDLCILLGCDYCSKIPGIGPQKAFDGIALHKDLETFIKSLDSTKHPVPEDFDFAAARKLFLNPDVTPAADITIEFKEPDAEGLIEFLVNEKRFSRDRVEKGIARLKAAFAKKTQGRLDSFFTITKKQPTPAVAAAPAKTGRQGEAADEPAAKLRKVGNAGAKKAVKK
jgi:flap endonuclease-1